MQIYYALCDPSYNTGGGNYWTWHASPLPLETLQKFYRDVAVKHLLADPFDLANPRFWDNFAPKTVRYGDWTVIYCFFSGGKDGSNRPGRYIILTAWIKTAETEDVDLSPIQTNGVFRSVLKNAKVLPVPPPKMLTEEWIIEPPKPEPASGDTYGISKPGSASAVSKQATSKHSETNGASPTSQKKEEKPTQQAIDVQQGGNTGKASRLDIIVVAMLSFLLGMGMGTCAGVALQYSLSILPFTVQKDGSNNTHTGS